MLEKHGEQFTRHFGDELHKRNMYALTLWLTSTCDVYLVGKMGPKCRPFSQLSHSALFIRRAIRPGGDWWLSNFLKVRSFRRDGEADGTGEGRSGRGNGNCFPREP